jgi:hypothetical protein
MASIISSLFGVGQQQQQQPAAQVIQQQLPKEVAPFYEKLLKESEALYKQQMEEGAPIYEGKTIAGFTPEQEQLFSGLQGLVGQQAPKFAEAEALTRGTAAKITPDEVQEFMNPYQQAVVDIEKREAQKQYESTVLPQLAAQAVASQGFGGSRQAILEGMAADTQQRLLADIQAKGSAQAYKDAMDQIAAQRQREGAAAQQLAQLAPAGFQAQAQELGAIGKVGDVKQQQAQLALDEAYKQFLQERQFPADALKQFQSVVQQFPNIPTQITRTPPPAQPGLAQTLLGGLGTAVGTYGAFGGFSPGGFMGMKQAETGGGIADLPIVYRQRPGRVRNIRDIRDRDENIFDTPAVDRLREQLQQLAPENIVPTGRGKKGAELREEAEDEKGLTSLNVKFDPNKLAFIGPGIDEAGQTVGVTTELDDTGKEDMSKTKVDTFGQPSEEFTRRLGFEPLPVEPQVDPEKPGAKTDLAKTLKDNIKIPETTDFRKMTAKETALTEAQKQKLADLKARQELAPQTMREGLFGTLAQLSSQYATDPNAKLLGKIGEFAKVGGQQFREGREKQLALKEKITDTKIDLAKADVDLERYKEDKATQADQKRFENIIKKEMYGIELTKRDQEWKRLNILDKQAYNDLIKAQSANLRNFTALNKQDIKNYAGRIDGVANRLLKNEKILNRLKELGISEKKFKNRIKKLKNKIDSGVRSKKAYSSEMGNFISSIEGASVGSDKRTDAFVDNGITKFILDDLENNLGV